MLPQRKHTVGNRRKFIVDYSNWMNRGTTVAGFTATSSSTTATVDTVSIDGDGEGVFFVNGGVEGETFQVSLVMTPTNGEIKNDVVPFLVVAA